MKARKIIPSYSSVDLPALQRKLSSLLSDGDTITIGSRGKKTVPIRHSYLKANICGANSTASKCNRSDAKSPSYHYQLYTTRGRTDTRDYLGYVGKHDHGRVAAAVERGRRIVELEKVIAELTDLNKTED